MNNETVLQDYIHFCENLSPDNTGRFGDFYTPDAYFKDPFNEVRGHDAIIAIFDHMFRKVDVPRFVITRSLLQEDEAFLLWDFQFYFKGKHASIQRIRGSTHLKFSPRHRIEYHRDYWDAAEELYEKLPLLGGFMRWLKRIANK